MDEDSHEIRLWLDDDLVDRAAPEGWVHVTTAPEAVEMLVAARVVELSLDHDLGDDEVAGRGVDVVDFIAEQQETGGPILWPRDGITLHTANPAGREAMARTIRRYAPSHANLHETLTPSGHPRFTFAPRAAEA